MKNRPVTSGITHNFYGRHAHDAERANSSAKAGRHEIISLSVDRN